MKALAPMLVLCCVAPYAGAQALLPVRAQAVRALGPMTLPAGTTLVVRTPDRVPMRVGAAVTSQLMYPVYADNELVLPAGTRVLGSVVGLERDPKRRLHSRLRADFTPYHVPQVQFTQLAGPDGTLIPIATTVAADGAPMFRAVPPPPATGGFLRKQLESAKQIVREDVAVVLGPEKGDRFKQFVYNQLPLHPERIEKETAWTTSTSAPFTLPAHGAIAEAAEPVKAPRHFWEEPAPPAAKAEEPAPGRWIVEAYLDEALSSETSKSGQVVTARIAQPVLGSDGSVEIPQGATLVGVVTQAAPAKSFGRTGTLSFTFRELRTPGTEMQNVETTLKGVDSAEGVALTSEGQARQSPKDKVTVPVILAFLASQALDDEGGRGHDLARKGAVSGAAGLGLIGTIVGAAARSAPAAAGIGYYGVALAFYDRWIAKGKEISFPRQTRIVVQTIARKGPAMKPDPSRLQSQP